jgi:ATP-dependent DNA ligase
MLHRRRGIGIAYAIFDVLDHGGLAMLNWPYRQRRELLEELNLRGGFLPRRVNETQR